MFSPIPSDIFQHNTNMLEEQYHKIQKRYEEKQQLQACLEETVETCHIEYTAQKIRKVVKIKVRKKAKMRKKAKKQRLIKEKKKKKQIEYLQQLQNKILVEDITLLEGTERFQITGSKYKEVTSGYKER